MWVVDQTKTPQVRPFEGDFAGYKVEILAEIRTNEEQALVEAERRARVREAKKEALISARKGGVAGVKTVTSADLVVATCECTKQPNSQGGTLDNNAMVLLFGKNDKKEKKKKIKAMTF